MMIARNMRCNPANSTNYESSVVAKYLYSNQEILNSKYKLGLLLQT
jgi:hypothetical protein